MALERGYGYLKDPAHVALAVLEVVPIADAELEHDAKLACDALRAALGVSGTSPVDSVPAPGATPEPWMTSYSAEPRTTDGTDYIITKVATQEFQLYRHEATHLHALLGRALGVQPSKERILQLAVEHLDCYVKDDDRNVFNGLPEDIGMTARVIAFAEAILKECCSARRADGVDSSRGGEA
jgi:hypothetical protein